MGCARPSSDLRQQQAGVECGILFMYPVLGGVDLEMEDVVGALSVYWNVPKASWRSLWNACTSTRELPPHCSWTTEFEA